MKLTAALLFSLALHGWLMQWTQTSVVVDSGSAGRAALALQQIRFVTVNTPAQAKKHQTADTKALTTTPVEVEYSALATAPKPEAIGPKPDTHPKPQPLSTPPATTEPAVDTRVAESEKPKLPADAQQDGGEKEVDLEEPSLEQVDPVVAADVVTTSEVEAQHAGFDQLPTMEEPRYRKAFPPAYPRLARRRGQQGLVMVRAKIGLDGKVEAVELMASSGYQSLDISALQTVAEWEFHPHRVNEQRSMAWVEVPVEFSLRR